MSNEIFVGADVSKAKFDAALCWKREATGLGTFTNDRQGLERLAKRLQKESEERGSAPIHLVVEPSGGYEMPLVVFAFERGWALSLPNPTRVRDWAKGMGIRAKNDALDSRLLAEYGDACRPAPQNCLPAEISELDSLLRRREDLEQMLREEKNRRQALDFKPYASDAARRSVERMIGLLEEELAEVEEAMKQVLKDNPDLKAEVKLLRTVPGIGRKTVLPILVFLHRWQARTAGKGTRKGIVAFAGLDPCEHRSGDSVYKRATISKMGCTYTRNRLYMAAKGGVRAKSGPLRHFYDRLRGRGKPYRLTLVAAARKILVWAFTIFTRQVPFDPSFHVSAKT